MPLQDISSLAGTISDSTSQVAPGSLPLPLQIHAATRQLHTDLNRLMTTRLPLCIPPNIDSPILYLVGVRRFAQIYFAFEDALHTAASSNQPYHSLAAQETICQASFDALRTLHVLHLSRTQRLKADISFLSHRFCVGMTPLEMDMFLQPSALAQDFLAHISQTAAEKPHILLAYTWIMHMALFNGGRWLRGQLVGAGEDFWTGKLEVSRDAERDSEGRDSEELHEHPCLSFWFFDGDRDGEDIKEEFKAKYSAVSETLTTVEREEIVEEAVLIFRKLASMVDELDDDCKCLCVEKRTAPNDEGGTINFGITDYIQRIWSSGARALSSSGFGWWTGKTVLARASDE